MTTIRPKPVAVSAPRAQARRLTAADLATAAKLKPAINDMMKLVRVGLTPPAQQPKWDAGKAVYRSPDGHALFPVELDTPIPGSADMFGRTALVDPSTNKFYIHTTGGIAGVSQFNGPLGLPTGAQFKGKHYSLAQLKTLAAAAAKPPAFHASPKVSAASYSGGMGIQPPPGVYGGPRVNVTATYPNITYQPSWKVKIDERTKTMTVTLDASAGDPNSRSMTKPVDLQIPVQRPATVGGTYTLLIKDYQGKVLNRSTFQNYLPA